MSLLSLRSNRRIGIASAASAVLVPILVLFASLWSFSDAAQTAICTPSHSSDLPEILGFNAPAVSDVPGGWLGKPAGTFSVSSKTVHNGHKVLVLHRNKSSPPQLSAVASCTRMDFAGKTITLQGDLRTEDVSGFAGLWLREVEEGTTLALNNMKKKNLRGTTGWKQYLVTLPVKDTAKQLVFGVLQTGTGKTWASHLQLLVDGKPIWKAPKAKVKKTALETDHEFDNGSGISIKKLSKLQIANLVTLGKVWGFLKYYDPTVTSGKRQWDYDLFRILPAILEAKSQKDANDALVAWIKKLGQVKPCDPCAHLKTDNLQFRPDLGWIQDQNRLGEVSQQLQDIRKNRRIGGQFYVALTPSVGNPTFEHELPYSFINFPDAGFQLLALYRFWNIIKYWYPNRDIIGEDWDEVLAEFIPRLALAKSRTDYERQMMALIASIHDTHANLWSSIKDRPPVGECHIPVRLRYVQDSFVVTEYLDNTSAASSPLRIGDVIVKLDGQPVSKLVRNWAPYYGASNKAALHRQIATYMTRGACGPATIGIRRDGHAMNIEAKRVTMPTEDMGEGTWDLPGPTFRLLSPQVAYLKLSSVKSDQVADDIKRAAGTKGLIIDIRNYPSQFVVFSLGDLLVDKPTPFVRFTQGDLSTPGAFHWTEPIALMPATPHYGGKVIVLVDGITLSQAEYTSMAFRAAGATIVGSTTSGADGNVSRVPLPGGLSALISGIGVFYPDKKPTQRVGIVPDVVVKPTIADVRAGRDPVLEKAIRLIVGPKVSEAQIRKMYQARASAPSTSSK